MSFQIFYLTGLARKCMFSATCGFCDTTQSRPGEPAFLRMDTDKTKRIRGRELQALRARLLGESPMCAMCSTAVATELDHIKALANGGTNDDRNLQGLCAECHETKTLKDLGQRPRVTTGLDGWPVADSPRGPRWRRAG